MNAQQAREDQLMSALCHATAIFGFWGGFISLIIWLIAGKENANLRFQAIQALTLQGIKLVISFAAGMIYMVGIFFVFMMPMLFMEGPMNGPTPSVTIVGFFIMVGCMMFAFVVVNPAITLVELVTASRVLKNPEFRIPILGLWVERWLEKSTAGS